MILLFLLSIVLGWVSGLDYKFYVSGIGSGESCDSEDRCHIDTALNKVSNITDENANVTIYVIGGSEERRYDCNIHKSYVEVSVSVLSIIGEGKMGARFYDSPPSATEPVPLLMVKNEALIVLSNIAIYDLKRPLFQFAALAEDKKGYSLRFEGVVVENANARLFQTPAQPQTPTCYFKELFFHNSYFEGNKGELIIVQNNLFDLNVEVSQSFFERNRQRIFEISGKKSVNIEFSDSIFSNNELSGAKSMIEVGKGVARADMYFESEKNFSITGCKFVGNRFPKFCSLGITGYSVVVHDSLFKDNMNYYSLHVTRVSLSIFQSVFENSRAISSQISDVICQSSIFRKNVNQCDEKDPAKGGAWCSVDDVSFLSLNCSFHNNSGYLGGSLGFMNPKHVFFDSQSRVLSSFAGTTDSYTDYGLGGGIFLDGEILEFDFRGEISLNNASLAGGGVYINNPEYIDSINLGNIPGLKLNHAINLTGINNNTAPNGIDIMTFPVSLRNDSDSTYVHCCSMKNVSCRYHYSCQFRVQFVDFFDEVVFTTTNRKFVVYVENSTSFEPKSFGPTFSTFNLFKFNFSVHEMVNESLLFFDIGFYPYAARAFNSSTRIMFDSSCPAPESNSSWLMFSVLFAISSLLVVFCLSAFSMICCFVCNKYLSKREWRDRSDFSVSIDYGTIQNEEIDDEEEFIFEIPGKKNMFFLGKKNGKGKIMMRDSSFFGFRYNEIVVFEGVFKNFRKNGIGKEFYPQGSGKDVKFDGYFVDGERDGIGIEYYTNGKRKFQGIFRGGKKEGKGVVYDELTGNEDYKGEWKDGEFRKLNLDNCPLKMVDLTKVIQENKKSLTLIGSGMYSRVFKIEIQGEPLAVKLIRDELLSDEESRDEYLAKIRYSSKLFGFLDHPGVLKIHSVCLSGTYLGYLCDLCIGTVASLIKSKTKKPLTYDRRMSILFQTCDAVRYLHKRSLMHRDLKWDNILFDKFGIIKVADFDFGRMDESSYRKSFSAKTFVGSPFNCSPEVIAGRNYNKSTDIYSFGIMIHQLLFNNLDCFGIVKAKSKECNMCHEFYTTQTLLHHVSHGLRPVIPKDHKYESWLIIMMKNCWSTNPKDRYSFQKIYDVMKRKYKAT